MVNLKTGKCDKFWRFSVQALRLSLAFAGGILATLLVLVVMLGIPAVLVFPVLSLPTVITPIQIVSFWLLLSAGWGLAFFAGGAVARCIAGPNRWGSWIGASCGVAFVIVFQLLPEVRWTYQPQHGWVTVAPEAPAIGSRNAVAGQFTPLLLLCLVIAGATLGWLGDVWMSGRLRPPVDA